MDLSRLPFIRLLDFWRQEQLAYRCVWAVAMGVVVLFSAAILYLVTDPTLFGLSLDLVSEARETWLPLWEISRSNLHMAIDLPVFRQTLSFSASPISPQATPVWIFLLAQSLGWSLALANISHLSSRWTYLILLLYAVFLHQCGIAHALGGQASWLGWALEFLWIIGALAFTYAGQMGWIQWKMPWRWLCLLTWTFGPMLLLGTLQSWLPLHDAMVGTYPMLLVLSFAFILFASKEPTNLLIYLATNRRNPAARLDSRLLLGLLLAMLALEFLWLLSTLHVLPMDEFQFIRPIHLFAVVAVFLPATSLNQFHQTKNIFPKSSQLSLALVSYSIIVLSFVGVTLTMMDPMFLLVIERMIAILFFSVGVGHVIFVYANHRPLLARKAHLYYLMARGRGFSLYIIWLIGMIGLVFSEGYQGWKTIGLSAHVYANLQGDQALIAGQSDLAFHLYKVALASSPSSPKSNYNLASLTLTNPEQAKQAVAFYEAATSVTEFPYARINAALLLQLMEQPDEALAILQLGKRKGHAAAELQQNLGVLFRQSGEVDSAVVAFQRALLLNPQLAASAISLADLYRDHNRPQEAASFYRLALESRQLSAPILAAGYEYELATGQKLGILPKEQKFEDPLLRYHMILRDWEVNDTLDWGKVQTLGLQSSEQGPLLLNMLRQMQQDSVDFAKSRAEFLSNSSPARAQSAWMVLGAAYWNFNVPEMAHNCFVRGAEAGSGKSALLAAEMLLEMGLYDSALVVLSELRVIEEDLWEPASRARAILLLAAGQSLYASLEYDLDQLSFDDWMRVARYAGNSDEYIPALAAYRKALELDSTSIQPYLQLGKEYTRHRDSLAFANLEAGLAQVDSTDASLTLALVEAHLAFGQFDRAAQVFSHVSDTSTREWLLVKAELALATGDSLKALACYRDLYAHNILDPGVLIRLSDLMMNRGHYTEVNQLLTTALQYNRENAEIWYRYALISKHWGFEQDAGFGASRAVQLTQDERFRQKILKEFTQEITSLVQ